MLKKILYLTLCVMTMLSMQLMATGFATLSSALVITEIMFNPPESGTDSLEFIEIYNNGSTPVNLANYTLTGGIYTFPNTVLPAGDYYVVAINATAFNNVYGFAPDGVFTNGLSNTGESIMLRDDLGVLLDSVFYRNGVNSWPAGGGTGHSIALCNVNSDNADGANWAAETNPIGVVINSLPVMATPGFANTCSVVNPDIAATAFLGVDSTYCNAGAISGSIIISNLGTATANQVYYNITANGFPVIFDSIATLASMTNDTIAIGPIPATSGVVTVVLTTTYAGDPNAANNSISMVVAVSNTTANATPTTTILCNAAATGEATAIGTDGLASTYNFSWGANAGSQTTALATGLAAGSYDVTITDSIGCADVATVVLTEPSAFSLTLNSITNVLCNGDATGEANFTVSGATPPYNYLWSNGVTTLNLSNTVAGIYMGTITDDNGCTESGVITITEPSALVASATDNGDGTATALGVGGVPNYSFTWDANTGSQTTAMVTGLTSNTAYAVTVTDANGCTDSTMVTVVFNDLKNIAHLANLNIFPNPASGNVFVELDLVQPSDVQVNVINAIGQSVLSKTLTNVQSEKIELEVSNFISGVYMVQFTIGTEQFNRKFVVTKK